MHESHRQRQKRCWRVVRILPLRADAAAARGRPRARARAGQPAIRTELKDELQRSLQTARGGIGGVRDRLKRAKLPNNQARVDT